MEAMHGWFFSTAEPRGRTREEKQQLLPADLELTILPLVTRCLEVGVISSLQTREVM